jgi:hypothetical protein
VEGVIAVEARSDQLDPEGFRHITAVAWHALCLLTFELRGIGTDDRPIINGRGNA